MCCLSDSQHAVGLRLGVELVGIADELLLQRLGHIVAQRQGQLLTDYLLAGDALYEAIPNEGSFTAWLPMDTDADAVRVFAG